MVRRRSEANRGEKLSLGLLTDDEALTCSLNQYLGGGLVCFTENLPEVDEDRLMLLSHCSPSCGSAAVPLDAGLGTRFPGIFRTELDRSSAGLPEWCTVSVINWLGRESRCEIRLDRKILGRFYDRGDRFLVGFFRSGRHEIADRDACLEAGPLPPHGCEVIKVQPYNENQPFLAGTNGHFSMGATEISSWRESDSGLALGVLWEWRRPLELRLLAPAGSRWLESPSARLSAPEVIEVTVPPQRRKVQEISLEFE